MRKFLKIIEIKNIYKAYDTPVLSDINLEINKGDFVVISGPSGCGKSTFLQILGLLDQPCQGTYLLDGNPVSGQNPTQLARLRHRYIGFMFQRYHLVNYLTVLDNVLLPTEYGIHENAREKAISLLTQFGLEEHMQKLPQMLSYGQQQRVSLCRSLITSPEIILADEPTGALDEDNAKTAISALHDLNKQGHTIIMITHNLDLIRKKDKHYRLKNGSLEKVK